MKKVASLVAAGAILLSTVGVAFASVHQFSFTNSTTTASSYTGSNTQTGGHRQTMFTGGSGAGSYSLTGGNVNVGHSHSVTQGAFTTSTTTAGSYTGSNHQTAGGPYTHQFMSTGGSDAYAGSLTVSNVNVSLY